MHACLRSLGSFLPLALLLSACGSAGDGPQPSPLPSSSTNGASDTGSVTGGTATAGTTSGGPGFGSGTTIGSTGSTGSTGTTGGSAPGPGAGGAGGSSGTPPIQPGMLTAGVWDDNRNFTRFMDYRATLQAQQVPGLLPISDAEHTAAHDASLTPAGPRATLDASFVIDTTGSMGDEILYLKTEFLAISNTIKTKYPNAEPRWSLVLYRDVGDEYVVRPFDFSDAETFQRNLAAQSANGGGDFPESPERGLAATAQFSWRADPATAKLLFWVADAPHHEQNARAMANALGQIRAQGIHIYPIASSGIDEFTELTMRTAAQLTLGRYIFLTNDSGVGGDHKEPSIPCYFVTRLDNAILRVVDIELSGAYREPAASEILRTGGSPQNGLCKLTSGADVSVF